VSDEKYYCTKSKYVLEHILRSYTLDIIKLTTCEIGKTNYINPNGEKYD